MKNEKQKKEKSQGAAPPRGDNSPTATKPVHDIVGGLLAWNNDELDEAGVVELFQEMVNTGLAWKLEGHVGRCADELIRAGRVTRPAPKPWTPGDHVGPYQYVDRVAVLNFGEQGEFRIGTYRAYNACGLVGYECNGIFILDERKRQVLCDEIAKADTGYFGVPAVQVREFERLKSLTFFQFRQFINSHPRSRHTI